MVISLAWRTMQGDGLVMLTVMMTDPLTANGSCRTLCLNGCLQLALAAAGFPVCLSGVVHSC